MSASEPVEAPDEGPEAVPAAEMPFARLCELLERLHKKKKEKQEQDKILTSFFDEFRLHAAQITGKKNCSLFPIMRLLLPAFDRERGAYHLKETSLGALLARVLALPPSSADAVRLTSYRSVANAQDSDLAGVAYFVLKNRLARQLGTLTVRDVNDGLDKIANAQVGGKARVLDEVFSAVLRQMSAEQVKWFLRVVLKDLRLRMGAARLLAAMHPDGPELFDACSSLLKTCSELEPGSTRPLELGVAVFCAVSPMLSERLDVTRVSRLPPATYVVESKFDGERFQLHMRDGVFEYFSRKGHSYGAHYGAGDARGLLTPRLRAGLAPADSLVLDGEMMGWHKQRQVFGTKGMAFDVKKITENSAFQPCFCVFDVLYYNGRSLAGPLAAGGAPLRDRLAVLDAVVTDVRGALHASRRRLVTDQSEILEALNKAMEDQEEGIVVKDLDSAYLANRRNAGWYKVKPEYTEGTMVELDLAVVGADEAGDKRHGRARSFLVACADAEPGVPPQRWVAVGRVATGLSFEQRERLGAALEPHWVSARAAPPPACLVFNKEKPDFWVQPEHSIVLQVRATELIRSTDFGTSHTLRFPRVTAVRDDKPVRDAMTLREFNALIADAGAVVKLSKREVDAAALEPSAPRRKRTARVLEVPAQFRATPAQDVEVVSAALRGRELCVVAGDEDCSKAELVRLVRAHGGRHVEHVGPETWCCVSARCVFRAGAARARDVDVASAAWLRALPAAAAPCELTPRDLLAASRSTRLRLCRRYDRCGDSYTEPTDEAELRRCFDKLDEEPEIHLTRAEMLELDRLLFGDKHPFSFLRNCCLHFPVSPPGRTPWRALAARMRGAALAEVSDPALTHAVLARGGPGAPGAALAEVSDPALTHAVLARGGPGAPGAALAEVGDPALTHAVLARGGPGAPGAALAEVSDPALTHAVLARGGPGAPGAALAEVGDPALTHAVLARGGPGAAAARSCRALVVADGWLDECLERQEYVNEKPFLFSSVDMYVP